MPFEYDPDKSAANAAKHGLDFDEAQALWDDANRLIIDARSQGELRSALIALMRDRVWIAFFTLRNGKVRLISVRRARDKEIALYENNLSS